MKRALVTLNIGSLPHFTASRPFFLGYCERYGIDFIELTERKLRLRPRWFAPRFGRAYEKLQIGEVLDSYDRVLYLDGDILVGAGAPDVFDCVEEISLGCVFEDIGPDAWKRQEELALAERKLGKLGSEERRYFNSGMFVVSRCHRRLFDPKNGAIGGRWPDQTFLNYHARRLDFPLRELDPSFNFLPVFPDWKSDASRRAQHFVHYAGKENKPVMARDLPVLAAGWDSSRTAQR